MQAPITLQIAIGFCSCIKLASLLKALETGKVVSNILKVIIMLMNCDGKKNFIVPNLEVLLDIRAHDVIIDKSLADIFNLGISSSASFSYIIANSTTKKPLKFTRLTHII